MKKYLIFLVILFSPFFAKADLLGFMDGNMYDPATGTWKCFFLMDGNCYDLKQNILAIRPPTPQILATTTPSTIITYDGSYTAPESPSLRLNSRIKSLFDSALPETREFYKDVSNVKMPEMTLEECNKATLAKLTLKEGSLPNDISYRAIITCGHKGLKVLGLSIMGTRDINNYFGNNPKIYPGEDFRDAMVELDLLLENNIKFGDTPISELIRISRLIKSSS